MELSVGDVMTRAVIYVKPSNNVRKVAELMKVEKKSKILIVQSRYATSNQKEETSKLLAAGPSGASVTLKGFEVYQVSSDPME